MTNPKWIIGMAMLFVLFTVICGVIEGTYGAETSKLYTLMHPSLTPWGVWDYVQNLWGMIWFDYPFFTGSWAIIKYVMFWPISIGLVGSFMITLFQGIFAVLRGLLPF